MRDETEARAIIDEAIERVGLDDVGDDWFLGPLEAFAHDLSQANLTDRGRAFMRSLAVRDVVRRLRVVDTLRAHPEIAEVPLPPIVYITGLERSGTTLLHNLVSLRRDARALLRWELMEPVPPPTAATYATDPRIASVQAAVEPLRGSLLEHMHWVDADDPEECAWGFIDAVSMLGQAASFCMPSWGRFLNERDLTPAFESYRRVVQLLTWQNPVPPGGCLVLKSPQIGRQISAFAKVFPEARFVIPHRDPFRALTSLAVMGASIVEPFCVENPLRRRGPDDVDLLDNVAAKLAAIEAFATEAPERLEHVPYPALASEPADTTLQLVDRLGLAPDPGHGERIEAFLAAQRSGRRAAPPRALDDMGYDHATVLAEPRVAQYCARFAVDAERERLTGQPRPQG